MELRYGDDSFIRGQSLNLRFESDVISDGTQTKRIAWNNFIQFESDVISDGTQTYKVFLMAHHEFESDVISDGTQT